MAGERLIGNRSVIDRVGHEAGGYDGRDGSQRLEDHLVEMGLGKNRMSGGGIYIVAYGGRHHERGVEQRDEVSESSARKHRLYCAANGRCAARFFIIEVGTSRL